MVISAASLTVAWEGQADESLESATPSRGVNATEEAPASSLMRVRILVVPTAAAILCPPSRVEFAMLSREGNATEVPLVASLTMRTLLLATTRTSRLESLESAVTSLLATVTVGRVAGSLMSRRLEARSGRKGSGPGVPGRPCALGRQDLLASATPSRGVSVTAGPAADSRMKRAAHKSPRVSAMLSREASATAESLADTPMNERSARSSWPFQPMKFRAQRFYCGADHCYHAPSIIQQN